MTQQLTLERRQAREQATAWLLPTLVLLFFLSGLCGLIYQVLWLRMLALVFGVTTWAASTVLSSFMAGLALGSFSAGRLSDRVRNPLAWYGIAEVLVGLSAIVTPWALDMVEQTYVALYSSLPHSSAGLTLIRFILSFIVLLVPTTLMGATLPIIVKSSLLSQQGLGARVSVLYATNTAGAIIGTALAGFVLIGSIGLNASFAIAATINIVVGIVAIVAARALSSGRQMRDDGRPINDIRRSSVIRRPSSEVGPVARRLILITFALSGFASLALEIIWFRVIVLFIPVTTYAFTVMLATVLAGIAVGSYVVTPLMRRRLDWLRIVALLELAIALTALVSFVLLSRAYDIVALFNAWLASRLFLRELAMMLVVSVVGIFPTTFLMGVAFPIGLDLYATGGTSDAGADSGERIGAFYSFNVFGSILGSLVAGFVLLPWLGSGGSLIAIALIPLAFGLALLATLPTTQRRFALVSAVAGVLLFGLLALTLPSPYDTVLAYRYKGQKLLWQEEGVQTTVTIHEDQAGARIMYLDGLHQANDTTPMVAYHRTIGLLPMVMSANPQDALVIGMGGGATPGAVSQFPQTTVDVVELSDTVARGAEFFRHVNYDLLRQPNVHLRVDDGRNHLLLTDKKYDVITADIIQPQHAGAGNLYSVEYYRLAREALKDDGLMLQWVSPPRESQYKLIMRTFLEVFPDATLWYQGSLMIGGKKPLRVSRSAFERKLQEPITREALATVGLGSFDALLNTYWANADEMRAFVGPGPLLTDAQPRVEYYLSLPRNDQSTDPNKVKGQFNPPVAP